MIDLDTAISMIHRADAQEIEPLCHEVMTRFNCLFPDSEMMLLSLPRNDLKERERIIDQMAAWLKTELIDHKE